METMKIRNPKTGREINVQAWDINPRDVLTKFKSKEFQTARDLSLHLLGDRRSVAKMQREDGGDSSANNFALRVFETGLDWGLGMRVMSHITTAVKVGKMPKPFKVAASRSGDVYIIGHSGTVY